MWCAMISQHYQFEIHTLRSQRPLGMQIIILFLALVLSFQSVTFYIIETRHTVHFDKDDHAMTETQKKSLVLFLSSCDISFEHRFRQEVFVVLNDGRSMLYGCKEGKDFILPGFPKLAELVACIVIEGKLHFCNELFVGKDKFEMYYRPSSIAALQAMLQQKANTLCCL